MLHLFFLLTSLFLFFKLGDFFWVSWGVLSLMYLLLLWGKDVSLEGLSGHHNLVVQTSLKLSFLLFLFSEVMFFFSIFWLFFDSSLSPSIEVGSVWPPYGVAPTSYLGLPLLGTALLLSSGVSVTWAQSQLLSNNSSFFSLFLTLLLAFSFLSLQGWEYYVSSFTISDSIYGSAFYFSTGFHGFHVFLGSLYLAQGLVRISFCQFTPTHHLGFEFAILYWHFVDLVWLLLYLCLYWWGS